MYVSHVRLFVTPWTVAHQAFLFMGLPRQEYWSGLPFPPTGDLPDPGIEFESYTGRWVLYCWGTWEAKCQGTSHKGPSQVFEQDPVGRSWNSPSPRPSALAPF